MRPDGLPETERNPKDIVGDSKVALWTVPPTAVIYMALAMQEGARKYGAYNWREKKIEAAQYLAAAMRHLLAILDGEWLDPESKDGQVPHLSEAMAGLGIYADAYETGNLIDNRPTKGTGAELLRKLRKT